MTEVNLKEFMCAGLHDNPAIWECKGIHFPNNEYVTLAEGDYDGVQALLLTDSDLVTIPRNTFKVLPNVVSVTFGECKLKVLHEWNFENGEDISEVNLNGNNIEEVSSAMFTYLTRVAYLNLDRNLLTQLGPNAVGNLVNLQSLYLSCNKITEISEHVFKSLPNLMNLNLTYNEIKVLPKNIFKGNPALVNFYIGNNFIEVIPDELFENNPELANTSFENNKITTIGRNAFFKSSNWDSINLSHNLFEIVYTPSVSSLSIENGQVKECYVLGKLEELNAANNHLEKLEIEDTTGLTTVDVKNNLLKDVSIFKPSIDMSKFDISGNPVVRLSEDMFTEWNELMELNISSTQLEYFNPKSIAHFKKLGVFGFDGNKFSKENLKEIEEKRDVLYLEKGNAS